MYTEATRGWWHAMNTEHVRNLDLTPQGLARSENAPPEVADYYPNNRNLPLRVATLDSYITLANRFRKQLINDPVARNMALGKDRIWFSAHPASVKPTDAEFAFFVQQFRSAAAPVLLLHSPEQMDGLAHQQASPGMLQDAPPPVCDRAEVTNLSYRPDSIWFRYQAAAAGWIMITDRWAPGWHATVNNQPTPIFGADFLFRAVPVAPGRNDIRLQYKPSGFLPLLGVSWGTLLAFAAAEIRRRVRRIPKSIAKEEDSAYLGKLGPLFDKAYYLRNNPGVMAQNEDPLAHYMRTGALELRNPHALFDAQYYVEQHPDVLAEKANPLLHFLTKGAGLGYNPNRLFDIDYYLWRNPDVKTSGMNPLVHFILSGAQKNLDPHPLFGMKDYADRYPDVIQAGTDPLSHYLEFGQYEKRIASRALYFHEALAPVDSAVHLVRDGRRNPQLDASLPVFCVYGPSHVGFLRNAVLPAFANQKTQFPIELNFLNYKSPHALLDSQEFPNGSITAIQDWSESRPSGHLGFGESVNYLFKVAQPPECFILCNPDSFPMPGCLTRLMKTYIQEGAAIVEARQWPNAHPKEFAIGTLETPWASGAFDLISAKAFEELGGFDPIYFLYMEDVDLSWRAWLSGYRVLHEPLALCTHATGLHTYQPARFYPEHFYSLRNFLVISYKFWGELGERVALEYLRQAKLPVELHAKIVESYNILKLNIKPVPGGGSNIDKVKILGLNLFHELHQ